MKSKLPGKKWYDRRLQYLSKMALLIIDDFGLKLLRPPEDEDFHDLIAER